MRAHSPSRCGPGLIFDGQNCSWSNGRHGGRICRPPAGDIDGRPLGGSRRRTPTPRARARAHPGPTEMRAPRRRSRSRRQAPGPGRRSPRSGSGRFGSGRSRTSPGRRGSAGGRAAASTCSWLSPSSWLWAVRKLGQFRSVSSACFGVAFRYSVIKPVARHDQCRGHGSRVRFDPVPRRRVGHRDGAAQPRQRPRRGRWRRAQPGERRWVAGAPVRALSPADTRTRTRTRSRPPEAARPRLHACSSSCSQTARAGGTFPVADPPSGGRSPPLPPLP